ncbi:MAG: pirin family protein [Acidimicrobiales bacterium]
MPAVTADPLTLPRLTAPGASRRPRPVRSVTTAPSGFEGEGFPVRRAFAGVDLAALDPFIMMDQMGSIDYGPGEPRGTSWHPHRGFETATYLLDGSFEHRDSNGGGGLITGGDTQWMTAGAGIHHIEAPPEELVVSGGLFHGVQLWVNLPKAQKGNRPRYQDITGDRLTLLGSATGGSIVRVIAGELDGHAGPGVTSSPISFVHASISPGEQLVLPWQPTYTALVYALAGNGSVGAERTPLQLGQLAILGAGDDVVLAAGDRHALDVLVLGGAPIGEPIAWYGPFVMNTRAEILQAFEDFQAGRLGRYV